MEEKKQKHYLIYQITNLVNGKIYIGKHETFNIEDNYFGSGNLIRAAIKKHGIENFVKTILIDLKSREEMNLLEKMVVTSEFCAKDDVYNIKVGGDGGWDYVNKVYTTKRRSNSKKTLYQDLDTKNRIMNAVRQGLSRIPLERKQQLIQKRTCKLRLFHKNHPLFNSKENNPMYGHVDSEETHKKRVLNHLGEKNSQYGKMWICNDLTKESTRIMKSDPIPEGWRKGRICKKNDCSFT